MHSARRLVLLVVSAVILAVLIFWPRSGPITVANPPQDKPTGVTRTLSPVGADSGSCTVKPCQTFKYALGKMRAGDTLTVADGTYSATTFKQTSKQSCSQSSPCLVKRDSTTGPGPVIAGCSTFTDLAWIAFADIDLTWGANCTVNSGHMVRFKGGHDWAWTDSEIYGSQNLSNINVTESGSTSPTNWTLARDCVRDNTSTDDPRAHLLYIGDIPNSTGGLMDRLVVAHNAHGQAVKFGGGNRAGEGPAGITFRYSTVFDSSDEDDTSPLIGFWGELTRDISMDHLLVVDAWAGWKDDQLPDDTVGVNTSAWSELGRPDPPFWYDSGTTHLFNPADATHVEDPMPWAELPADTLWRSQDCIAQPQAGTAAAAFGRFAS